MPRFQRIWTGPRFGPLSGKAEPMKNQPIVSLLEIHKLMYFLQTAG